MDTTNLEYSRKINASPDYVFHCLTDPKARKIWNSPGEDAVFQVTSDSDVAAGNRETGQVGPAENPYVTAHADWVILDPGTRLVYVETLEAEGTPLSSSLVCAELSADGTATQLDMHVHIVSLAGPDVIGEVTEGWNFAIDAVSDFAANAD